MANIEKLKPDQVLYTVSKGKMGNTTVQTVHVHSVRVVSVDLETRTVVASWNSNAHRTYREQQVKSWRVDKPHLVRSILGNYRLATRDESKTKAQHENQGQ